MSLMLEITLANEPKLLTFFYDDVELKQLEERVLKNHLS